MSSIFSNSLFVILLILFKNSDNVESKCKIFDELAISETFDKLLGQWNLIYSNVAEDSLSSLTFLKKDGNTVEFKRRTSDGKQETGVIQDVDLERKMLTVGSVQSPFWILKSDFKNFLLVYQCAKPVSLSNPDQQNDFYRILSKSDVISESDLSELLKTLKEISPDIVMNKRNQSLVSKEHHLHSNMSVNNEEECHNETDGKQFISGCSLKHCPMVSYLPLDYNEFDKIEGSWYLQYSSKPIDFELSIEIEKTESKTPVLKRYIIVRNGTDIKSLGIIELIEPAGITEMRLMTWIGTCHIHQEQFYNKILSTDFSSYWIAIRMAPNVTWEKQIWTRAKHPEQSALQTIFDEFQGLSLRNNLSVTLRQVNQNRTAKNIAAEQLTCKDLSDKGIQNINLNRLRGNWRSILLKVDGVKCLAMKDRVRNGSKSDSNEFSFDVFTDKARVWTGKFKLNDKSLTHYSSVLQQERNITILDTDYINFFIFYECNIVVIKGESIKIVEYGLMARNPVVSENIMFNARQVFNQSGLTVFNEVDQKSCQFKKYPPVVRTKYCDSVRNYTVNNFDLDLLLGRWWLKYSTLRNLSDVWTEWKRNPDFTSDYTHIFQQINDDKVVKMFARLDEPTGYLMVKIGELEDEPEIPYKFLSLSKDKYYILYLCSNMGVKTPVLEKLGVYSKRCEMDNVVKDMVSEVALSVGLFDQMNRIDQHNCEQDNKYMTKLLTKKCIKFHDSELVEPKLNLMAGRWDLHLLSREIPHKFDYEMVVKTKNDLDYTIFPEQCHSRKTLLNGTNLLKTMTKTSDYMVLGNEAIISVNYSSYVLRYSCVQYEQNHRFHVTDLLMLSLRPETSSQLFQNPNLFVDIINKIPEKTLSKLKPLIGSLTDRKNILNKDFGKKTTEMVEKRLNKFRTDNNLSNRTDKEMFEFLRLNCDRFDDDEQIFFHLSTITFSNHTLDMTSYMDDRLSFNRTIINKVSQFSYELSLFKGNKFVAHSDRYYDKNSRTFWGYTEGRRFIKIYLFANPDYRAVYRCEEQGLTAKRILRLYSTENTTKPRDWYSYLELLMSSLKPKTLGKIADLIEDLYPIGRPVVSKGKLTLKTTYTKFSTRINKFKVIFKNDSKSSKPDEEVNKFLIDNCKNFETDEIIDPNLSKLSGKWNIDWTNSLSYNQTKVHGLNFIDIIQRNSDSFTLNSCFGNCLSHPLNQNSKTNFVKIRNKKIFQRSTKGSTRGLMTIIWTDYDNYLIGFDCIENEVNGVLAVNEILTFYSRNGTKKSIDLGKYFELIGKQLKQKTILKLYHPMSTLLPSNPQIIDKNIKPVTKYLRAQNLTGIQFEERVKFVNKISYEFIPKGLIISKINKYVKSQHFRSTTKNRLTEQNVNKVFAKVCDRFDDNELKNAIKNIQQSLGSWSVDYETRVKFGTNFDSFDVHPDMQSNAFNWNYFLKNDLVLTKDFVVYNQWSRIRQYNAQRELLVPLLLDSNHFVIYMCEEDVFTSVPTAREYLHFASRKTNETNLEYYLNKLSILKPNTLSKIIDLISNIRPLDERNKQISQTRAKNRNPKLSQSIYIESILQKHCKYFSPKDTVEPNFKKLLGNYKLRFATTNDFYKQYDTIEWIDGDDRFFSKLRLGNQFICKGKLSRISYTNQFKEDFHNRQAVQTILYTDYSEVVVVYSCKENVHNIRRPVIENLKFLVKNNSNRVNYDIVDFRNLLFTKLSPNVYQSIRGFIPNLKYVYNASNSLVNATNPEEECPNLDNFAQMDIDFKRLTGHWNAIFTSNKRWDKDFISNDDSYDKSTDSIIQTKIISGQKHKVIVKHSDKNGKQQIIVHDTLFDSWILATDYNTFKLSYTCHTKKVNGIKRKIDLLRLYTKNIEAIDFDKKLLEILIKKSEVIGKQLEPINRSSCHVSKASPVKVDQLLSSSYPANADQPLASSNPDTTSHQH